MSDDEGRFEAWGLQPFEPVRLVVDTTSLSMPQWIPAAPGLIVAPYPSEIANVRIPILVGSVIEGRLELGESNGATLPGAIGLTLENLETGERRAVEVFTDGSFYAMGVRPGSYALRPDPAVLDALGLSADLVSVEVPSRAVEPTSRPPILLRLHSAGTRVDGRASSQARLPPPN